MRFLHGDRFWHAFKGLAASSLDQPSNVGFFHSLQMKLSRIGPDFTGTTKGALPPSKAATDSDDYVMAMRKDPKSGLPIPSELEPVNTTREAGLLGFVQPWNPKIKHFLLEQPLKNFDLLGYVRMALRRMRLGKRVREDKEVGKLYQDEGLREFIEAADEGAPGLY